MFINNPPTEIVDGFWMLGSAEYPLYLYQGADHGTIFEGGIGPSGPLLREQLQELGIAGDFVRQLVITHAHPDHVMAVPKIREYCPAARVLASELAARTIGVEKAVSFFCKMDDALTGSLVAAGLVRREHQRSALAENRINVDQVLSEGDTVDVDNDVGFQVLATPGHSDCSLSFFEPNRRILIISDATGYYMPQHNGWWPNYFTDYGTYFAAIERLAGIGAEVLCLSHNAVVHGAEDVAAYFQGAIDATQSYHERIVSESKSGKSVREIAEVLGSEVHEKTPLMPVDFFQKNCGILVKQSLRHEGISLDD